MQFRHCDAADIAEIAGQHVQHGHVEIRGRAQTDGHFRRQAQLERRIAVNQSAGLARKFGKQRKDIVVYLRGGLVRPFGTAARACGSRGDGVGQIGVVEDAVDFLARNAQQVETVLVDVDDIGRRALLGGCKVDLGRAGHGDFQIAVGDGCLEDILRACLPFGVDAGRGAVGIVAVRLGASGHFVRAPLGIGRRPVALFLLSEDFPGAAGRSHDFNDHGVDIRQQFRRDGGIGRGDERGVLRDARPVLRRKPHARIREDKAVLRGLFKSRFHDSS